MTEYTTKLWTVIGIVGPQISSKDDRCVHLYPQIPGGGKYRCATVYEDRFDELPKPIAKRMASDEILMGTAPEMQQAKNQGLLIPCDPFMIEVHVKDGKDTKNLARVVGPGSQPAHAPAGRTAASTGLQAGSGEPMEFNPLPEEDVTNGFGQIVAESAMKIGAMLPTLAEFAGIEGGEEIGPLNSEWQKMVANWIWRDANDQWRIVRPSLLRAFQASEEGVVDDSWWKKSATASVIDGERADFLAAISAHPSISDVEGALDYCRWLGIEGSAAKAVDRLVQARKIWLLASLTDDPFNLGVEEAVDIAEYAYIDDDDEVPF